jgi:hypothetical protein
MQNAGITIATSMGVNQIGAVATATVTENPMIIRSAAYSGSALAIGLGVMGMMRGERDAGMSMLIGGVASAAGQFAIQTLPTLQVAQMEAAVAQQNTLLLK